ncbi:MAG TPA: efflux RND transporter periplasmic adaptor subunit [Kiritimatiellia bacterium]|nr:efflux RND transporter periplasmic adaptor subunit [Kiritimatiellia bacterium]
MKKYVWIAVALALAAGGWWWWRARTARKAAPVYREVVVERGTVRQTAIATGVLEPQTRLELTSPVAGRIEEILVREGDAVKRGQVVAWVSSTERSTLLDAARARGEEELARWEKLYNPTPVIAPLDGAVIARSLEPGQGVSADKALLVLSDRLIVRAQVDETDMARIALDQQAEVRLDAYPGRPLNARVAHIAFESRTVNNVTIYDVEVLPEQTPPFARSGMSAAVSFVFGETNNVLLLPMEAVQGGGRASAVRVPASSQHGAPETREITTGLDDGRRVEIRGGLKEGDIVLVEEINFGASADRKNSPLTPFGGRRR